MNGFTYCNPVKVVFGLGTLAEAGVEAGKLGRRALVVSYDDKSVSGTLAKLKELFAAAGVASEEFLEVTPNPPIEMVARGVEGVKTVSFNADGVLASIRPSPPKCSRRFWRGRCEVSKFLSF